ncbi:GNAT family N-acetyltransferase [Streptomyces sp. NBC_01142]|uniref:GNAT family N-acetyltransferase n=1 Tax=Streptomyces sp. NBC_01142 TaxID=2975865 RepID=UPI002251951E|nr:GNAT family N-acetyltransferase [Streptomyces sp. NBC_01142]MCX4821411.1 GNAT family N-acetyltransferase [Streptomyces sp. NBC_01142]
MTFLPRTDTGTDDGLASRVPVPVPAPMRFAGPDGRLLRLRAVTEEDLPELHRLDKEIFQEEAYPYFVLRQFYDLYRDDLFVLDDGRTFHGYVLAGTKPDKSRSWILGLAIHQQRRGHGLGRWLMGEALHRLRAEGVGEVWLTVEPANTTAIKLYAAMGFTRLGHRDDYFGPGADRLLMTLPLMTDGLTG